MKERLELDRLIEAEQAIAPPVERMDEGWQRLSQALSSGAPTPPVPVDGPLALHAGGVGAKGIAVLALVGAGALGGGGWLAARALGTGAEPRPAAAAEQTASAVSRTSAAAPMAEPIESSAPEGVRPRPAPARSRARAPLRPSSEAAAPTGGFDEELALIKKAKALLDSGRTQAGLAALAEHARSYPHGVFAGEREALRVLAACGGASERGRQAARRFLRSHPASPLVDRVRRACGLEQEEGAP